MKKDEQQNDALTFVQSFMLTGVVGIVVVVVYVLYHVFFGRLA